jgi:hypothetical protein
MIEESKYFGGTGITLQKLKAVKPTINVDGTEYNIETWLAECTIFDNLIPGKSKAWIPYNVWKQGTVASVVWNRYNFKDYGFTTEETQDWWIAIPYCMVENPDSEVDVYYVYEISFYKKWKRKTQQNHLTKQQQKPKGKFLSKNDIASIKRQEVITNSQNRKNGK